MYMYVYAYFEYTMLHCMCLHPLFVQLFIYLFHTMEASTAKVSGVHSCAMLCTATDQLAYTQLQWQQILYETNPGKRIHMGGGGTVEGGGGQWEGGSGGEHWSGGHWRR